MNISKMTRYDLEAAFNEQADWCAILAKKVAALETELHALKGQNLVMSEENARLNGLLSDEYWKNDQYREQQEAMDRYHGAWS